MSEELESVINQEYLSQEYSHNEEIGLVFSFRPDYVFCKDNFINAFVLRKSRSVPDFVLQRFSEQTILPNKEIKKYIAFAEKPLLGTIRSCHKKNIGVCYLSKNKIKIIEPILHASSVNEDTVNITPVFKMAETHLFFASKQELVERGIGVRTVEKIYRMWHKPVFAKLVEEDNRYGEMSREKLRELIFLCIDESDYYVGIYEERHSSIVEEETYYVLKKKEFENIFLFFKKGEETEKSWEMLLKHIHSRYEIHNKTVWYIRYEDHTDFENKLHEKIMRLISNIHKKNGATFL